MAATALITGAAGNLGMAMVNGFLAEGFQVLGILAPGSPTERLPVHSKLIIKEADLSDERATEELIWEQISQIGSIEVSVLTVGGFTMGNISETNLRDVQQQIELNFNTTYSVIRPLFRHMLTMGRGRIFLTGSVPGLSMQKAKGMTAYGLSKSLNFRLAELMNEEAEGKDVITQVIVPSTIDTIANRKAMPDADFSKWVRPEAIAQETIKHIENVSPNRLILF